MQDTLRSPYNQIDGNSQVIREMDFDGTNVMFSNHEIFETYYDRNVDGKEPGETIFDRGINLKEEEKFEM